MNIINSNHKARCCSWSHVYMHVWNHTVATNCIPLIRTRLFLFSDPAFPFPPPLSPPTNYQTEGSGARLYRPQSFYFFSPWVKARFRFQCILKSILHEKTTNELLISLYTLLRVCTKQLCTWPRSLTENISECRLFYPTQVFSVR